MSIQIEVAYNDKDIAKEKGAFWDTEFKTWYIPDKKKITDFADWIPEDSDIIIKSPFIIAKNTRFCWKCNKETTLIAIGAKQFMLSDYVNDESDEVKWKLEKYLTLFSDVTYIPKKIAELIQKKFPFYRYSYSKTINGKYWANNCIHCNSLQGDWFNHHEPDGAFFPCSPEEAGLIELIKIETKHDFPIVGGYSMSDSSDMIDKFAKRTQ